MRRSDPFDHGGNPLLRWAGLPLGSGPRGPWTDSAARWEDGQVTNGGTNRLERRRDAVDLVLLSGVVVVVGAGFAQGVWLPNLHNGLLALAFASVGAYVLHQQPRNRCGQAFLATGVVEAVMFLGRQIGHDPAPGTSEWWGWLGVWPLVVGLALVTLSVILFPDGSLPSPAWKRAMAGVWIMFMIGIGTTARKCWRCASAKSNTAPASPPCMTTTPPPMTRTAASS